MSVVGEWRGGNYCGDVVVVADAFFSVVRVLLHNVCGQFCIEFVQ